MNYYKLILLSLCGLFLQGSDAHSTKDDELSETTAANDDDTSPLQRTLWDPRRGNVGSITERLKWQLTASETQGGWWGTSQTVKALRATTPQDLAPLLHQATKESAQKLYEARQALDVSMQQGFKDMSDATRAMYSLAAHRGTLEYGLESNDLDFVSPDIIATALQTTKNEALETALLFESMTNRFRDLTLILLATREALHQKNRKAPFNPSISKIAQMMLEHAAEERKKRTKVAQKEQKRQAELRRAQEEVAEAARQTALVQQQLEARKKAFIAQQKEIETLKAQLQKEKEKNE